MEAETPEQDIVVTTDDVVDENHPKPEETPYPQEASDE